MSNRPPIFYGRCVGGPFNGKDMAHAVQAYVVAINRHMPMKALVGMVATSDPDIVFGTYLWKTETETWAWEPPNRETSAAKRRVSP